MKKIYRHQRNILEICKDLTLKRTILEYRKDLKTKRNNLRDFKRFSRQKK